MKKILLALGALIAMPAFAAGTYNCDISVSKDGEPVGKIKIEQNMGLSAGALYTLLVSKKQNFLGNTVEETDVVLSGILRSGATAADSSLEGDISIRKTILKRTIKTEKTLITKIKGSGDLTIDATTAGYTVTGACIYKN